MPYQTEQRKMIMERYVRGWERAREMGYTDAEIMAMDEWPWDRRRRVDLSGRQHVSPPLMTPWKEVAMLNKTKTIADLEAAIAAAQKELALLRRIPTEPAERMTTFAVTFNGSKPYTYVALRIDGKWSVSGKHFRGERYTWSGIFARFEEIHGRVCYMATPTEYRHETFRPV